MSEIDTIIGEHISRIVRAENMCMERAIHKYLDGLPWWRRLFKKRHLKKNLSIKAWPDGKQQLVTKSGTILAETRPPIYIFTKE